MKSSILSSISKSFRHEWFQILAILICAISHFSTGLISSWTSPSILELSEDKVHYDITFDETSYFMVISPIGVICSSLIFAKTIDVFGRKWMFMFIVVPQIICWLLTATATSIYIFYIARFTAGIGEALLFAVLPTYIGEIATPTVRGTWGSMTLFLGHFGEFLIHLIGSYFNIVQTAYICLAVPVVFGMAFIFMPETPYYLLMKNKQDQAKKSLQILRRTNDVDEELKRIESDVKRQMSETGTWKDVFTIPSNRKALGAAAFLRISQQTAGNGTFALYTQYIFQKAGGTLSASASSMVFLGLMTVLMTIAAYTVDYFGRKKSFLYSNLFCGIMLFGEFVYFFIEQYYPEVDLNAVKWIPLALMIGYAVFFSFGLAVCPTLMLSELFSASIKGKALCLMNLTYAASNCIMPKIFHLLDKEIGIYAPFLLFSVCCFVSTVLSIYLVPETKGRTLEQIQQALKKNDRRQESQANDV